MTTTQKTRNHPDACDWDDPERDAWHAEMESRPPTPCVECGAPIGYFDGTCPNGHVPPGNQGALVGRDDVRPERSNPDGGGRKAHRTDEPTPAQVSYLTSLMRDLGSDDPDAAVDAIREASLPVGDWTRKVVSGLIDTSKAAVEEKRRDERKPGGVRPNRFAGTCVLCGNNVAEGTGRIEENGGRWNTFHLDGTCPPKFVAPTHGTASTDVAAVPEGHYAIDPAEPGKNETVFYRVDRPESGQWAGRVFVKLIVGGHPDSRVPAKQAPGILARIAEAGIAESRQRYGVEIGQCAKCNRHLTDDVSRARGIGPECIKKEGWS